MIILWGDVSRSGGGGYGNEPIQWKREREIEELQSNIVNGEKRIKTGIF